MLWFIFIVLVKFSSNLSLCSVFTNGVCDKFVTVALLEGYEIYSAQAKIIHGSANASPCIIFGLH